MNLPEREYPSTMQVEPNMGMIITTANKLWGIAQNIIRGDIDYDDVLADVQLSFVLARDTYDPTKGWNFSTYFMRAAWNNGMRMLNARNSSVPESCVDWALGWAENEVAQTAYELPYDAVLDQDFRRELMNRLPERERNVVALMLNPTKDLMEYREGLRSQGQRISKEITIAGVCDYIGISRRARSTVKDRIREACLNIGMLH